MIATAMGGLETVNDASERLRAVEVAFARFEAGISEKFERYHADADRFWNDAWPRVESNIDKVSGALGALERRMEHVEKEQAVTRVKLGLWGGIAGLVSLAVTIARFLLD